MPKILITSTVPNGRTAVGVNGVVRYVPHGKTTEVTDAELEVLQSSDRSGQTLKVLDDGVEAEAQPIEHTTASEAPESRADPATPALVTGGGGSGGEAPESRADPATPAAIDGEPGADSGSPEARAGAEAQGDSGPNGGPPPPPKKGRGKDFDTATFLDRSIADIREDLDELDGEQLDALIKAEGERETPARVTLIEALESKKNQLNKG